MIHVPNNVPNQVLSYVRQNENDKVLALLNLCDKPQEVELYETLFEGEYLDFFTGENCQLEGGTTFKMQPWSYLVFIKP